MIELPFEPVASGSEGAMIAEWSAANEATWSPWLDAAKGAMN